MARALSAAFGLLMVAAGAVEAGRYALVASAVGVLAVVAGVRFGAAATLAVVATIAALTASDPSPSIAAVAGLAALCYLVLRHSPRRAGITAPTMFGAIGLSLIAVLGAAVPLAVPWVPLVVPLAALLMYVLVVAPLGR